MAQNWGHRVHGQGEQVIYCRPEEGENERSELREKFTGADNEQCRNSLK